ncbi:MAG: transcription-repair coupling factor [Cytophagaceae bacterium]|nr:transcription-repair coupling factor [Cytophagaceae bacterium]
MKHEEFLRFFKEDALIATLAEELKQGRSNVWAKGLVGSQDAIVAGLVSEWVDQHTIFVLHDKDEAVYFANDLQSLWPDKPILLFPNSYKRPYQYEEVENANVLQRAEVLNALQQEGAKPWLVTYPEALLEKVINKKSLVNNTFRISTGAKLDVHFLSEWLSSYDFDKTDFVFEAGQFSIRGGIVDIFSFSNEYPYRLELFGDEVESIREFHPESQLSIQKKTEIAIIPDVQSKLLQETRVSLFEFIPEDTLVWLKDVVHALDMVETGFLKTQQEFERIKSKTGNSALITDAEHLFCTRALLEEQLLQRSTVEFGNQFYFPAKRTLQFETKPQPSFNKEFAILTEDLKEKQLAGYVNVLATESVKQMERLNSIFDEVDSSLQYHTLLLPLREGFCDELQKVVCYTDHQIFERYYRFKSKERFTKSKAMTLKELRTLQPGDFVTHSEYGVARFAGLEKVEVSGRQQEAIRLIFRDNDLMYISIHALHKISKYSGKDGVAPVVSKLGSGEWEAKKSKVKKQVKDIAKELIRLYALRKAAPGFAFSADTFLQAELESSFIYEDTPDQAKATNDVKKDMEAPHPMDRLVCGDVGFGKTEVAVRAAFKAVCDNKQVAVLVPTTVLATQHYKTFRDRLKNFPCTVEYINRFKSAAQVKETLQRVKEGKTSILIGTHKLIGKEVQFKDLGLLIIDEEQKFGVKVKEKLREFKVNVDTLTLTATPIPRTLHFSLMGARDLSIIATPPPNRQPVTTAIHVFDEVLIRDAVVQELKRGGQVFFVHNRISDIEEVAGKIKRLVPDSKIAVGHGQMEGEKLERIMLGFVDGDYDVLVSTNIIESGLDIPNANTIIINQAQNFGLSDLHQMRGRVGRSNKKAYCYLLTPPISVLASDSRKRLSALEEFSDLGDGFKVAMRDMDIRGAGNLLGAEQSGFISDLGFEMYHKILDESIQELKETEFKELFQHELDMRELKALSPDCTIETDLSIIIPDDYVSNITERLSLYSAIDNIKEEGELQMFVLSLVDRFGTLPQETEALIETIRLRWKAEKLGFEKLMLKNDTLKGYFVPANNESYYRSEVFGAILNYVQQNQKRAKLKEVSKKLMLQVEFVGSIESAHTLLDGILELIPEKSTQA